MDITTAIAVARVHMEADIPVFFWGKPGVGKSDMTRQIAKYDNLPLIDVRATLLDTVDIRGLPSIEDGKAVWCQPDFLPRVDRDGKRGILFLDELADAPLAVQSSFYQLILDRRLGEYVFPTGWRIFAAGNRQGDGAAAQRMSTALADRFAQIDIEENVEAWGEWAVDNGINPLVLAFIRFRGDLLHNMEKGDKLFATPRSWARVAKAIDTMPKVGAAESLRLALVKSIVGDKAATEFEGFARMYGKLVPLETILSDPDNAPLYHEPNERWAIATGLARKVERDNVDAGLRYMKRLGEGEFASCFVLDAVRRKPKLKETRTFIDWAAENHVNLV